MKHTDSALNIKSYDDERRIIRGIATTPEIDRSGDIVVPEGMKFKNPMPLLWQHQADKPVGTVRFSKPTAAGIEFEATLPKILEPGALKDRVDEAWQSVKASLVTAVSIGFRTLDGAIEVMENGGYKFLKSECMELSLVTIPANSSALITAIKSFDTAHTHPSSGNSATAEIARNDSPGATGKTTAASRGSVKLIPRKSK